MRLTCLWYLPFFLSSHKFSVSLLSASLTLFPPLSLLIPLLTASLPFSLSISLALSLSFFPSLTPSTFLSFTPSPFLRQWTSQLWVCSLAVFPVRSQCVLSLLTPLRSFGFNISSHSSRGAFIIRVCVVGGGGSVYCTLTVCSRDPSFLSLSDYLHTVILM